MIHGHIDFVSRTRVEGWLHSDVIALVGAQLLAYIDQDRVGGGAIGIFRDDLLQAGLGDGRSGFNFPIELKPSHDPRVLDVRLEGSNALIRQTDTCLMPRHEPLAARAAPRDADTLAWMRARGWLTAEQHQIQGALSRFGVYRQHLPLAAANRGMPHWLETLAGVAGEFLQLHLQRHVTPQIHEAVWEKNLGLLRTQLHTEFPAVAPVIGLWAPWTNCLNVSEGSHLGLRLLEPISGVDYEFGEEHLLWLNLDTNFHVPTGGFTSPSTAFVPAR